MARLRPGHFLCLVTFDPTPPDVTVGCVTDTRFLRSVPNRLRRVIVTAFAIYAGSLLGTALGVRFVADWLTNRGTPSPIPPILLVTVMVVFAVVLTDFVTRWRAGEEPRTGNDRFDISDDQLRVMARVIPCGLGSIAVMVYGLISSGGWEPLPHRFGTPYRIIHDHSNFVRTVSEGRYRHVLEGNLLFTIGMSLVFLSLCYGAVRVQSVPQAPPRMAGAVAARTKETPGA